MRLLAFAAAAASAASAVGSYAPSVGNHFVQLSAAAYCDSGAISSWSCGPCKTVNVTSAAAIDNGLSDVQGIVGYDAAAAEIVVSFRGSQDIANWIEDLDFTKVGGFPAQCPQCEVHQGFYLAYLSVQQQVVSAVRALAARFPAARVALTGHSLGGALATVCATDLIFTYGLPVSRLVTFGCPRVGDSTFSTTLQQALAAAGAQSYRVVHNEDIVPHLPPISFGFHHLAQEIWYTEDFSSYKECDPSGEDATCSDSLPLPISVDDHLTYLGVDVSGSC